MPIDYLHLTDPLSKQFFIFYSHAKLAYISVCAVTLRSGLLVTILKKAGQKFQFYSIILIFDSQDLEQ